MLQRTCILAGANGWKVGNNLVGNQQVQGALHSQPGYHSTHTKQRLGESRGLGYGREGGDETTRTKKAALDPEREMTKFDISIPPYPDESGHGGSTARRTGFLYQFPTRRFPNPKRHRPIMVTPHANLMMSLQTANMRTARAYLPFEAKGKKVIMRLEYKRPTPPGKRTARENYNRLKFGLYDLDRIMPPLWGPQEGFKLDRDEWAFKLLYFSHPIVESELCAKAAEYPHNPFDNDKDLVLALERLVSREYVRRVKGKSLNHPNVTNEQYYWTLMPDELEFGAKVVTEEKYMQSMREGRPVTNPVYPLRKEMLLKTYQEKHNTYAFFDEIRDLGKLKRFVEFCKTERQAVEQQLDAIECGVEFPDDTDEELDAAERKRSYPDPPTFLAPKPKKINWRKTGHWSDSVPDRQTPAMAGA